MTVSQTIPRDIKIKKESFEYYLNNGEILRILFNHDEILRILLKHMKKSEES